MKLVIPGRLPGLNEYTKANRANKYVGAKMKKEAEDYIKGHIRLQLKDKITGKAYIEFTWIEQNRKRDLDNICSAKKFILDALVSEGIITADGWKGVSGFTDHFEIDKDVPRVVVEIREA